ncbi:type II toxin-antitoxin system RelE/ParE family toxin [Rhizobium leguminosarum]|uniref:Type II toxin-antitoxin system RelE/ParE family toxin n=1 Tax=Rhizobium leguminosarum TaxID=384 RepID=A0A2Z4YKY7_RHILE|nr:type II toxin-antitoxin system RelE/ParE family toxin [Rhizobium leguminosarum]AXA41876.1 hypothetical protein DLJ82_4313 [Rhizobium leguminosarum]
MTYKVQFYPDFVPEWKELEMGLKELVGEVFDHLEDDGPFLGRPEVDTLSGSDYANMKEIRVKFGAQSAIILCGGDKQGMNKALFYKQLINKADARFAAWLKEKKNEH